MTKLNQKPTDLVNDFGGLNFVEDPDSQLIIGLDFGTTFSGIAYIFTEQNKPDPEAVTDWPGTAGLKVPKTPTLIDYTAPSGGKSFSWGSKVNPTSKGRLEGIKLLLDPDQPVPLYVPASNTKKELAKLGKPPLDVATDYLKALYQHAMGHINNAYPKDFVDMQQKKFVLTVPAVWSDKAKDLTLKAAKNADIHPVELIKEPEAAALYTLHYLKGRALAVGDAFVLCDAGGGTVDLISYEVDKVTASKSDKEHPAKNFGGAVAGSLILNKRFEEAVKNIVGDEEFFELKKSEGFADAVKQFDREVKPAFCGDTDQAWNIFEPLVTAIIQLVAEQVANVRIKRMGSNHPKGKEIKAIFLVGGFGSSQYLKKRLELANTDIQIIQPPDAWGAIVKYVTTSPSHQYKESEDAGQEKWWDSYEGFYRVQKMTWYLNYDDDLVREKRIEFAFYRSLPKDYQPEDLIFDDQLLECAQIDAPKYPTAGVTKVNVKLRSDLRKVPKEAFEHKVTSGGTAYVVIWYKLQDINLNRDSPYYGFFHKPEVERIYMHSFVESTSSKSAVVIF
ncbi:putative Heat shock 70 kDa protein 12A [Glarea lozoyensis 74030]|uniref:Putative Heat shock 70 kDa protein 12A n=1 Tax=Glarea lozoyensis (strain ATCC 74030 / MF5533) TaxID=1104152 RepID=H0EGL2_GLAL7|nr:putative Heat shock 70 kDa protein 12A [Glarea lozoyensis 74030]